MARSITSSDANGATFETVGSTGGFSAGDLVYYGSTGYNKITASPPSTTTSSPTKAYPTLPVNGGESGYFQPTNFNGLGFSRSVALLSNGNAVAVYANPIDGYPYFVVYNPSTRAIVAGPTVISTTYTMTAANSGNGLNIGVSAFSGGNFLVYWGNNAGGIANRTNYATYTNAGATVVAVTQDIALAVNNTASGLMRGVTLANGGFVLAFGNGNDIHFRAYDASGVAQFAWVSLTNFCSSSASTGTQFWGMTARSDNTYLLTGANPVSGNTYNYAIFNYAGTAVVSTTSFSPVASGGAFGATDCTTLSDGTTFVIAYAGEVSTGSVGWAFRFLPTGNVLGSANFLQGNFNSDTLVASANYMRVWPLDSGRFLMTGSTDGSSLGCYAIFNSSGTPLLGTSGTFGTASLIRSFGGFFRNAVNMQGVIVYGGVAEVYGINSLTTNTSQNVFCRINLTTYNLVSSTTVNGAVSILSSSVPTTTYTTANSTPSKASYSLSNGVYPYAPKAGGAVTAAGVYPTPTQILNSVSSFDMCTLTNGNVCLITNSSTTSYTTAYIYNPVTLALISSSVLTAAGNSSQNGTTGISMTNVRVTPLSGGSFCVGVGTSSTNLRLTAYTSAFVQQGSSVNIATVSQNYTTGGNNWAICTISGDRVVVVYSTTALLTFYAVYSSTLTTVVSATSTGVTDASSVRTLAVAPIPKGFMFACSRNSVNDTRFANFIEYSANNFTQPSYAVGSAGSQNNIYTFLATNGNGTCYLLNTTSNTSTVRAPLATSALALTTVNSAALTVVSSAVGVTASGNIVAIGQNNTSPYNTNVGPCANGLSQVTLTGWTGPITRAECQQLRVIPLYGNLVLVGYLVDNNDGMCFGTLQVNGAPDSQVFSTSDSSNGVPIYPLATTNTSPALANLTFAGVAVTDCAAGGTGVIQTTGTTNLNSTYPTTTAQTFDYTGQAAPGVKGTISGRSISMRKS